MPPFGACSAISRHSFTSPSGTGRVRSRRLRTDLVVVSSSSGVSGTPGMIAHQGQYRARWRWSAAEGCGWGEGRELVQLVRVVVQYLVHHALVIACVPGDIERHRLDVRGRDRVPGPGVPAQRRLDRRDELIHFGAAVARP